MADEAGTGHGIPSQYDLLWPVLEAVRRLGGSGTNEQIAEAVARSVELSEADWEVQYEQSGEPVFLNRLAFVRTYLRKSGLLASPKRKMWAITEDGRRMRNEEETVTHVKEYMRPTFPSDTVTWVMAAGAGGQAWPGFLECGIAALGWSVGDLRKYGDQRGLREAVKQSDGAGAHATSMLWNFGPFGLMKRGNTIVARQGQHRILGYGQVVSDYRYDESLLPGYAHTREVKWHPFEGHRRTSWRLPKNTLVDYSRQKRLEDLLQELKDLPVVLNTGSEPKPVVTGRTLKWTSYSLEDALKDLFIPDDQFERMHRALQSRKNLVLQGPPGTGKTFMARRLAWCLIDEKNPDVVAMVQFHQAYAYEDFVQGYRPTEEGGFKLRNGVFFEFCEKARATPDIPHVLVIDEINRGNLSRIFGELLMLVEADKRDEEYAVSLTYGEPDDLFYVPPNLHVLGLMNTADRSLAVVDYALRRRFAFETLEPAFGKEKFRRFLVDKRGVAEEFAEKIDRRLEELNERIAGDSELGRGFCIGHSYFVPGEGEGVSQEWYEEVVRTQIEPLLAEYWFDSPDKAKKAVEELLAP